MIFTVKKERKEMLVDPDVTQTIKLLSPTYTAWPPRVIP